MNIYLNLIFDSIPLGSLADWAMVLLTLLSSGFLLFNLYQQRRINRLSLLKHKYEIRPLFSCRVAKWPSQEHIDVCNLTIELENNVIATDIRLFSFDGSRIGPCYQMIKSGICCKLTISNNINMLEFHESKNPLVLKYSDIEGRLYCQEIHYGVIFGAHIGVPRLIKDI